MNDFPAQLFDLLARATATAESRVLYLLALLCILMALDFLLGSLAAWRNPAVKFSSQEGINGILRKLASILVLAVCIPVSALIPQGTGLVALAVLYVGYLVLELASIVENLDQLGVPVGALKRFIENVSNSVTGDKK